MQGAILCYSVTGNTSLVAQRVARALPFPFEVVDITLLPEVDVAAFDVVGFAVPTDFWGISQRVSGFIAGLPLQQGRPAFVMNTFGGASGKALVRLWDAVGSRGFRVVAGYSVHMPDSYPPLIARGFASSDAPSAAELAKLDSFIAKLAATLSALGDGHEAPTGRFSLGLVDRLLPERDRSTGLHALGERSVDEQACTRCGTCLKGCLTGAIRLDPLPVFDASLCCGCWRCYNRCPSRAIRTKKCAGTPFYAGPTDALRERMLRA